MAWMSVAAVIVLWMGGFWLWKMEMGEAGGSIPASIYGGISLLALGVMAGIRPWGLPQAQELVLMAFLLPLAAVDWRWKRVPNRILGLALLCRMLLAGVELWYWKGQALERWAGDLAAAVAVMGFFLLALLLSKNGIGMGDIKLFGVMGIFLGMERTLGALFMGMLAAFALSVVLLVSRRKGRKDTIAFVPSICLGAYVYFVLRVA